MASINRLAKGEPESYLGENETCDNCGRAIKVGDRVIQKFIGVVMHCAEPLDEYGQLAIAAPSQYSVVHTDCLAN